MKCRLSNTLRRPNQFAEAMSLVELIGVLAIFLTLAAAAIPVAIRYLDRVASERENASLRAIGDALQEGIVRTRTIPTNTDWHIFVATNSGADIRSLTNNLRNRRRFLQFDPGSSWFNANLRPYTQSASGTPTLPDNARVLLVSTIAGDLPFTYLDSTEFNALWNSPDGALPPGSPWTGWSGRAYDVKVHRVNLAPLFVKLVLSTYVMGTNGLGHYGFEGRTSIYDAPMGNGVSAYYLRGTELNLRSSTNPAISPDHTHLLQEDTSYVFENNVWQSSIIGPIPTLGINDLTNIVDAFLNATPNTNSRFYTSTFPNTQQVLVVSTMRNYMSNYSLWATSNFTAAAKVSLGLESNRVAMMDAIQGLYSQASKWTNTPPPNYVP